MKERLLLAVTGSIAAYKAPFILRGLSERGFSVPVVLTQAAQKFVGRVTFESLTSEGVYDDLWTPRQSLSHISLLEGTKLVLVAPATANIMAKAAHGLADDLLSSLLLAADPRILLFAPAMNDGMWRNPATQENVSTLKARGARFVEPAEGELACGAVGKGRLAEADLIILEAERIVRAHSTLKDKKIVVTAGRTEESLDPVRVLTNRSSGRMGTETALAFARAGADVTLVTGEVSVLPPAGLRHISAPSSSLMLEALASLVPSADVLVMAAAVADYAPAEPASAKLKESTLTIELKKTPDILAALAGFPAVKIGFSVETGSDWSASAKQKLEAKKLDAIVANPSSVIGSQKTQATILLSSGETIEIEPTDKAALAEKLVEVARGLLERKGRNA